MPKAAYQLLVVFVVFSAAVYLLLMIGPEESATKAGERDITLPRAPAEAKAVANPIPPSDQVLVEGERIYQTKGTCFTCHGTTGRGDGPAGLELNPRPRNFTNPRFHELRTDGEMFWVIRNGSPGTRMFSYSPSIITEDEAWKVIHYLRTLPTRAGTLASG
ncbi:MAG TPA: c-type cytochrome, partial [Nitrospiria bacterium]|nr:c-type cytochrome [Nitrospiria bacterium]